jgi:class 3 adenylate cyclase/tetratricopeptide (TPR) repeat protein
VLFADVSGFTALTARLVAALGRRRGAEEVARHLNRLYDALVAEVTRGGGSVIGFSGDAVLAYFPGDDGRSAARAAGCMQTAMEPFADVVVEGLAGERVSLSLRVAVTAGPVSRYVVGDPAVQLIDVVAGETVNRLERLSAAARQGEVVVGPNVMRSLDPRVRAERRDTGDGHGGFRLALPLPVGERAEEPAGAPAAPLDEARLAPWVLPTVRRRLAEGQGEFLTELRPVAALFMRFAGIDFDGDPEAGDKLDELVRWVQAEVGRLGGAVVQLTTGDKGTYLYAAFGAPVSFGDDAHRCAAAGLRLRRAAGRFPYLAAVSVGLGYGTARTGAYGGRSRRTYGALGPETNMAARMMTLAPSGAAYASPAFARACSDAFQLRQVATVPVKGAAEPVPVWELIAAEGRTTVIVPSTAGRQPVVGRGAELAVLVEAVMSARFGRGQAVQLTAEAGMGKSHLVAAALQAAGARDLEVLSGASQPFAGEAPYRVWSTVFADLLGLDRDAPAAARAAAVAGAVARVDPELAPRAPLLAPVLDLVIEENDLVASLGPELRPASRLELLVSLLNAHARRLAGLGRTLVVVLEDLHAADALSGELLEAWARHLPDVPAALVTAARPTSGASRSRAPVLPGAAQVLLGPLSAGEAEELARARLESRGAGWVGDALLARLLERAEGNPLFVCALVDELVENAGDIGRSGDAALPQTLHALALARLDRLGEQEQASLKVASVIGREFPVPWLQACRPERPAPSVAADVAAASRAGVAVPVSEEPPAYRFDHAITHEAAYESLPHSLKLELHGRVARHVEERVASPADPHLDELAFHYDRSDAIAKRREYLWKAGMAAKANYATEAATGYLERLLTVVSGPEALPALLAMGEVEAFAGDHAGADARLRQALAVAVAAGDELAETTARRLLGELYERQGDHTGARSWLEEAVRAARRLGAREELVKALLALGGNVLWHLGAYAEATAMLREALSVAAELGDDPARARALHGLASVALYRGQKEEAERLFTSSLEVRRAANDELGLANALNNLAIIAADDGRDAEAEELLRDSLAIRRRLGDVAGTAVALNNLGFMAAQRGDLQEAESLYEQSLASRTSLGDRLGMAVSLNNLGDLARRRGDPAAARSLYQRSLDHAHAIDNRREAATALVGLAAVSPDPAEALRLCACAEALLASIGAAPDQDVRRTLDEVKASAVAAAGDEAWAAAEREAGSLAFAGIVALALGQRAITGDAGLAL